MICVFQGLADPFGRLRRVPETSRAAWRRRMSAVLSASGDFENYGFQAQATGRLKQALVCLPALREAKLFG
ncbi:hypothetical protein A8B82_19635 [Sulfitobacter sp. EhC04]|nr:hypothetical protein A8B82_19635 [Sulfitobacter sp. EhC04]